MIFNLKMADLFSIKCAFFPGQSKNLSVITLIQAFELANGYIQCNRNKLELTGAELISGLK